MKEIKKVCVLGAGLMGRQIALNTAQYDYEVTLYDSVPEALQGGADWAEEYLAGRIKKGRMTEEQVAGIKKRFHPEADFEAAAKDADLVIEAIIEDEAIKRDAFKKLNATCSVDTIFATNSSRMVSSLFVDCVDNPARLANLHYFNPAIVMELTEVVSGEHTSMDTVEILMEFSRKTGKTPIWVRKELDGFIVNNIVTAVSRTGYGLVEGGYATPMEVDLGAEKGLNYPMGPFRMQDLTGIDLTYHIMERRYKESGEKPLGYDIVKEKYDKGEWGRKTGKGWYDYSDEK
ncbi:MAG: 3-hydroxyacyl-CoA dehydrogenase family protein [Oscillospiraceae bacterium]